MPLLEQSVQEMRQHLNELIYNGFIADTPPQWLPHYPRFLKAIEIRLRKLGSAGLVRDQNASAQIAPLWRQYQERRRENEQREIVDPELEQYRWMLEELRVSLFAQELKTSMPISVKRLEAQWAKLRS